MAIEKPIELGNGVTVHYHRVVSVNSITNVQSVIEVASYTSEAKREEEKRNIAALKERAEAVAAIQTQIEEQASDEEAGESVPLPDIPAEIEPCNVLISTDYIAVDYDRDLDIGGAYGLLKTLPKYEGAKDLLETEQIAEMADAAAAVAVAGQMRIASMMAVRSLPLTDEQAMSVSAIIDDWGDGSHYEDGMVRRYGGALYRCLQAHDSQASWTPDAAPSLWKRIGDPDPSGVWPWVQPLGATDAYAKGDKVAHEGETWVSEIDANVWEPGVHGWVREPSGA